MGAFHPQVVHFAVALLVVGVLLRLVSLLGRPQFAGPAAALLLGLGTLAAVGATVTGDAAHSPVERVPGSAAAVKKHEDWGERTRNVFLAVIALEIAAIVLARKGRAKPALLASAVVGLGGLVCLFEAGEHGGELVYSYAGGVGIRSGDAADVGRLLIAGSYHQAELDRKAGKPEEAAALVDGLARRFPADSGIQLLAAESLLLDRKDAAAALQTLARIAVPKDDRRLRFRHAWIMADALEAQGQADAARATLQALRSDFPDSERLRKRLGEAPAGR